MITIPIDDDVAFIVDAQAKQEIAGQFQRATGLPSYWRDKAAHGTVSNISEIEAHEAIASLLCFAQFIHNNWNELTEPSL